MQLFPIPKEKNDQLPFLEDPNCKDVYQKHLDYYKVVGFQAPWVGYFVLLNGRWVAAAGFKGAPKNKVVEIAYHTFESYEGQGVGTEVCRQLVGIARNTDPTVQVIALTLPHENASTSILKKNGFVFTGVVEDPEDGEIWRWEYQNGNL